MDKFFEKMLTLTHSAVDRLYDVFRNVVGILADDVKPTKFEYVPDQNTYRFEVAGIVGTIKLNLELFDIDIKIFTDPKTLVAECVIDIEGRFDEHYNRINNADANKLVHNFFGKIGEIKFETPSESDTEPETVEAEVVEDPNNE